MVQAAASISGSARTAHYNKVFLAGLRRAITSDPDFNDGFYADKPPIKGIKVFASIYAGWAFSEPFYRQEIWRFFGAKDVEQFIDIFWDAFYVKNDANDLLAEIWTWWNGDLGDHPTFAGSFAQALASIQARTIILNGALDSTSRPSTASTRLGIFRPRKPGRSPVSGVTWRPSTRRTRPSSTLRCASSSTRRAASEERARDLAGDP